LPGQSRGRYVSNGGALTARNVDIGGEGEGTWEIIDPRTQLTIEGFANFGPFAAFAATPGTSIRMTGTVFGNESTDPVALAGLANTTFIFEGGTEDIDPFEVAGRDLGAVPEGFENNFALRGLILGAAAGVGQIELVDQIDNQPLWEGAEALYVHKFAIGPGSTLDLAGLNLYYLSGSIDPTARFSGGQPLRIPPQVVLTSMATGSWSEASTWDDQTQVPTLLADTVVADDTVTVASDGKAYSLLIDDRAGQVVVARDGSLEVANDVEVAAGRLDVQGSLYAGTAVGLLAGASIDVSGILVAQQINIAGGVFASSDVGTVGAARLDLAGGTVSAAQPITVTESLTIGEGVSISVTGAPLGVRGDDLFNSAERELVFQGGEVTIHSGGAAIDMGDTDLIVVDETMLDLAGAASATFDELILAPGSVLSIDADGQVDLTFRSVYGSGSIMGSSVLVNIAELASPGDSGREITLAAVGPDVLAGHLAMLNALGLPADADNVAMASLGGESYLVHTAVPEPATLVLLALGGLGGAGTSRTQTKIGCPHHPTGHGPIRNVSRIRRNVGFPLSGGSTE